MIYDLTPLLRLRQGVVVYVVMPISCQYIWNDTDGFGPSIRL